MKPVVECCNFCTECRPVINFNNVSQAAFTQKDPKSTNRKSSHQSLFALLVSVHTKPYHKILMKLTPWVDFINFLHAIFTQKDPKSTTRQLSHQGLVCTFEDFCTQNGIGG